MTEAATMEPEETITQEPETNEPTETEKNAEKLDRLQHWRRELLAAETECREIEADYLSSKETTNDLKKQFDGAQARVRAIVRRGTELDQGTLPFTEDQMDDDPEPLIDEGGAMPVGSIGLTAKQVALFAEADVKTVADLEGLMNGEGIDSVPGFGQVTVDKITDKYMAFREQHPVPVPEETDEETSDAESNEDTESETEAEAD